MERLDALTPEPGETLKKNAVTCLFSPRATKDMLTWYADQISGAESAVMFTGAFGVSEILAPAFAEDRDFLRFILLEKPPTKKTKELLGRDRDLVIVYGNVLGEAFTANKKGELTLRRKIPGAAWRQLTEEREKAWQEFHREFARPDREVSKPEQKKDLHEKFGDAAKGADRSAKSGRTIEDVLAERTNRKGWRARRTAAERKADGSYRERERGEDDRGRSRQRDGYERD